MKIYVDLISKKNNDDGTHYFISVPVSETESISFDNTYKGHRVIKQVLVDEKFTPTDSKVTSEWDTVLVEDGKFFGIEHVFWVDLGKKDLCNNEMWETVWEKQISDELDKDLLKYSNLIQDNYRELDKFSKEIKEFENLLSKEILY